MMISRIGQCKRENNLLLLRQESCTRASYKTPIYGSQAALDALALDLNPRIINAVGIPMETFSDLLECVAFTLWHPMRPKAGFGGMFGLGFHR
jgi:hypothetical protein